jgi:hypothetical protein
VNDPDRYGSSDSGHGHVPADDGQAASWIPAPRHPGSPPPPLDPPPLDSPPLGSPSLDSPPLSAPLLDCPPAPAGGGPPPGPALSLGGWQPEEHATSLSQPQYGAPPFGPDLNLGGWAAGQPPGSVAGPTGPWTGYREGWFRRLLARLRGRRRRA